MTSILLRYRGREVRAEDARFIGELIDRHPDASRRRLSTLLCEAWDWRQANGELRDMVCRSLMLELHRAGHIRLPAKRCSPPNNATARRRRKAVEVDCAPLERPLRELRPIVIRQVRRSAEEPLFDSLIERHHYLAYTRPVGEHLKHLAFACDGRPLACLAWSSAPRHLGPRDRYIGWPASTRRANLRLLAYNTRFLILPWVRAPRLASHLLGRATRRLSADWQALYGHPVHYAETFIDPARFRGTCYLAANWIPLGLTTGRGHNARTSRADQPKKQVLGYPLVRHFRRRLLEVDDG